MTPPITHEERIRRWRAGRAGSGAPSVERDPANDAAALEALRLHGECLVGDRLPTGEQVLALLVSALAERPHRSVAERRAVFQALQSGLVRGLEKASLPVENADFLEGQLRTTVKLVEQDIRAGRDVFVAGYVPTEFAALHTRLVEGRERRRRQRLASAARAARRTASRHDVPLPIALSAVETSDLRVLRDRLDVIHATAPLRRVAAPQSRAAIVLPLLLLQVRVVRAESRLALFWALMAPVVLLTLISSLYFLTGSHYILDMDVATFAMLGATTWIMFRQLIFRCSTSYVSSRALINLEAVTPLVAMLVQGVLYTLIYAGVFTVLIFAGYQIGWITLPESWSGFAFYVAMMACGGMAIGLIFGCIAVSWPFFLRFAPVLERALEIFSGVFFVSEQLPEQYRPYFLWSPFAHGMQLLRSAYFPGYKSADASPSYFLTSLVFLAAIGLIAERRMRSDVQPM